MPDQNSTPLSIAHRFIDEVGDTTFYGKGREVILGKEGVSLVFGMSIVKFSRPVAEVRSEIIALQKQVEGDPLLNTIPSIVKRMNNGGFFFHACKDSDDVRAIFLRYLRELRKRAEITVAFMEK